MLLNHTQTGFENILRNQRITQCNHGTKLIENGERNYL